MHKLEEIELKQFGGVNTIMDSGNAGVSKSRVCRNLLLRPLGALSVPPRWSSFSPNGTALDLGFITNIDFRFNAGVDLLLEDELQLGTESFWNCTPDPLTGLIVPVREDYSGTMLSANLAISASQVLAFKQADGTNWQLGADAAALGHFTQKLGSVPYSTNVYTSDQAFRFGFGPVFTDSAGNQWKLRVSTVFGLLADLL